MSPATPKPSCLTDPRISHRHNCYEPKPVLFDSPPDPPDDLSEDTKRIWRDHTAMIWKLSPELLTTLDLDLFRCLCDSLANYRRCQMDIERHGLTQINKKTGIETVRPTVRMQHRFMNDYLKLTAKFGLSPSSRSHLKLTATSRKNNNNLL